MVVRDGKQLRRFGNRTNGLRPCDPLVPPTDGRRLEPAERRRSRGGVSTLRTDRRLLETLMNPSMSSPLRTQGGLHNADWTARDDVSTVSQALPSHFWEPVAVAKYNLVADRELKRE